MPAMTRPSKKAEKIAFAILGIPANMRSARSVRTNKKERILDYEDTRLER